MMWPTPPKMWPIPIAVLNNDQLGDEPTQISGVDAVSAQGGSASIDDNGTPGDPSDDFIQYTPAAGFSGTDSFDYTIEDADGETSTATVGSNCKCNRK